MKPASHRRSPASPSERYRVLLEIGRSITSTVASEEDLYIALYRETARVMQVDGFYVSLYDPDEDLATVVFWADRGRGRNASIVYRGSDSAVIRHDRASLVTDLLEAQSLLVIGEDHSQVTRAAISAPLRSRGKVLGVISAQSYRAGAYSNNDLELLQGIADLAAVAMENVRHVQDLERQRREAERMEELSRALASSLESETVLEKVVEAAMDLLEADGAIVWLLDAYEATVGAARGPSSPNVGTRFRIDESLAKRIRTEGQPIIVEDLQNSPLVPEPLRQPRPARNALIVPLRGADRVLGALSVAVARNGRFQPGDARLLQRLAGHASGALENARLHAALQTLSLTDPLTGLPNRRQLEVHLTREFAAAQRGRPLSVVLFDVDRFKEYNDTEGHVAGDQALRAVARVLAEETRAMNLVARYGGDEFLTVLSDTGMVGGRQHARRVHAHVERDPELTSRGIRLSSGVATFSEEMYRPEDLIRSADQDLYRSKAMARNGTAS